MKDIYISRVDGRWSCYIPSTGAVIKSASDLIGFYYELKEKYPDYRMRCVRNDGIDERIRKTPMHIMRKDFTR